MNIPKNIKKEHVLKAIEKIDKEKIPDNASSKFYDLIYNGKTYPPKLVLSYANTFVNGEALDRNTFDSVIAF
jgi:5-methylcytosine-specific restriction protein B